MIFQYGLILFALFALWRAIRQYRQHEISGYWALVWSGMWIVGIVIALLPRMTDAIATRVGVGRGADLLVYVAVVILLYASHRMLVRQRIMQNEITELVRSIAVSEGRKRDV